MYPPGVTYLFGTFRLIPSRQILLNGDSRVLIGGRALDLLIELVARHGELVSKQELMARAWPRAVVEESNIKVHIAALRKALGEGSQEQRFVATVVGRGYRFVAPVGREVFSSGPLPANLPRPSSHNNIPAALVRPIGRSETTRGVLTCLEQTLLLTITGAGGIGKTTVALAIAQMMVTRVSTTSDS